MFNMILYTKRLENAGFNREQAEVQVDVLMEMIVDGVSTKKDLEIQSALTSKEFVKLRGEMTAEFAAVRAEMSSEFADVRAEMKAEFAAVRGEMNSESAAIRAEFSTKLLALEHRLTLRMGSMFVASTAITISALAIIVK